MYLLLLTPSIPNSTEENLQGNQSPICIDTQCHPYQGELLYCWRYSVQVDHFPAEVGRHCNTACLRYAVPQERSSLGKGHVDWDRTEAMVDMERIDVMSLEAIVLECRR